MAPGDTVTRIGACILAAGDSTRMGYPKALLEREGRTALAVLVDAAARAGCDPVVVVLGRHAQRVTRAVDGHLARARVVVNPDPDAGRTGSLQRALAAVTEDVDALLVWPVDHPCVSTATVRSLADAFRRHHDHRVVVPVHAGRRGHPILLDADACDAVRAMGADAPLRDVVRAAGDGLRLLPVPDSGILVNVDTPEDAARAGWRVPAEGLLAGHPE